MKDIGVFILGETDYVAYQHTFKEAKELADHGASYIAQHLKEAMENGELDAQLEVASGAVKAGLKK